MSISILKWKIKINHFFAKRIRVNRVNPYRLNLRLQVFLQQAENLGLKKKLKGGGITDFKYDERMNFEGSDDPTTFFTSGERQSMILEMVNDLRAVQGDELGKIKFVEGQQIGKNIMSINKPDTNLFESSQFLTLC